jgi:hypothetical protein
LPSLLQILSVAFSEAGDQIYAAGIENVVNVWDLRREEVSMTLSGHSDSITGMRLSPDGTHLLTNSMDNTLRWLLLCLPVVPACCACLWVWPLVFCQAPMGRGACKRLMISRCPCPAECGTCGRMRLPTGAPRCLRGMCTPLKRTCCAATGAQTDKRCGQ